MGKDGAVRSKRATRWAVPIISAPKPLVSCVDIKRAEGSSKETFFAASGPEEAGVVGCSKRNESGGPNSEALQFKLATNNNSVSGAYVRWGGMLATVEP